MLIIGIAGGSGSGKSTVVRHITRSLPDKAVTILPQDAYYFDQGHLSPEERARINFDHPSSIEWELMVAHIDVLRHGQPIDMPVYSYITCTRARDVIPIEPTRVLIVEGILIFTHPELRKRMNTKVYVDAPADERLIRIIRRDTQERGRSYQEAITHYERFVKPMHEQFIEPTKQYADIIVPQGGENSVAIEIMASRIRMNLNN